MMFNLNHKNFAKDNSKMYFEANLLSPDEMMTKDFKKDNLQVMSNPIINSHNQSILPSSEYQYQPIKTFTRLSHEPLKNSARKSYEQINVNKVNLQINPNRNILSLIRGNTSNSRERPTALK